MKSHPYSSIYLVIAILLLLSGCTAINPVTPDLDIQPTVAVEEFSYESYGDVLGRYVDQDGLVDYPALKQSPSSLDQFYRQLSQFSPDSHPDLFPTKNHKLAYWLNAYNATVLKGVLEYYPIESVEDVKPPALLFFLPSKSGFFLFQRFTYGGAQTNLYNLENSVVRGRFEEPRIHFALNCASRSCPKLPGVPFLPERLDEQLDAESAKFINDQSRNRYDSSENILYLSSIFDWYEGDFTAWLKKEHPEKDPTLVEYALLYLNGETVKSIRLQKEAPRVEFLPYDWGLNVQGK